MVDWPALTVTRLADLVTRRLDLEHVLAGLDVLDVDGHRAHLGAVEEHLGAGDVGQDPDDAALAADGGL
jgi:hypothetical protein